MPRWAPQSSWDVAERQLNHRRNGHRAFQPSLRDEFIGFVPVQGNETPVYLRWSLRDRGFNRRGQSPQASLSSSISRGQRLQASPRVLKRLATFDGHFATANSIIGGSLTKRGL